LLTNNQGEIWLSSGLLSGVFTDYCLKIRMSQLSSTSTMSHLSRDTLSSGHQCTTRLDLGRGLVRSSADRAGTHLPLIRPDDVSPREGPRSSRVMHWCTHHWRPNSRNVDRTMLVHTGSISVLAMAPDRSWLCSGSADGSLRLWDIEISAQRSILFSDSGPVGYVVILPDAQRLVSGYGDGELRLWGAAKALRCFKWVTQTRIGE